MTAIVVPSLSGIGRMVPVHGTATVTNVGINWAVTAYTVPTGRIFVVDTVMVICWGGALPVVSQILAYDSASALQGWLAREAYTAINTPVYLPGPVWLAEGWTLRMANEGGDATTDMVWSFSGRLFDWMDVT